MNKRKNRQKVLGICAAVMGTLAVFCAVCLLLSGRKLAGLEQAASRVDAFYQEPMEEGFVNQQALADFEENAQGKAQDEGVLAVYQSPEGIEFISRSEFWDEAKLEALYQELLQNKHGEELNSLSKVVVYPQEDAFAAATHQNTQEVNTLFFRFPALEENFGLDFFRSAGVITLYDGDRLQTAEDMASSLSHEYGHHYTFYHMFAEDVSDEDFLESDYARLRGLDPSQVLFDQEDAQAYYDNHQWYLVEIAAEDYVTLMGSPNSREVERYYDVQEYLDGAGGESRFARNAQVQENLCIPMASEVPGLADYYYSFLGEKAPRFPAKQDIQLSFQKNEIGYDLVSGYQTFVSYDISWNKAYGEDAVYTLVSYQKENYNESFYCVKTVQAGEPASAVIGCPTRTYGDSLFWQDDGLAQGTRTFVVTAILPDGTMYFSDPADVTF